jgi:exodeoxyribonuclease VII large subunit
VRQRIPPRSFDYVSTPLFPEPSKAPGASKETAISITDLNNSTKVVVEEAFGRFWVRGEVGDFKRYRSGHWYFTLRDSASQIQCVVWASDQRGMPTSPDDGMKVVALAQMTMYPARGNLQLRITRIEAEGDGLFRKAMEETLARLRAEGLLAADRKRPIPLFPRSLGVVTSPSGAALHDIVSVAKRRRPGIEIIVACSSVQGDTAPRELCDALSRIGRWKTIDVIIIGRGGGARDDLRAFNHEAVARAIAACEVPVISAIGHEVDTTVCDLVADFRAATPSAAAERAVPALADLQTRLASRRYSLIAAATQRSASARSEVKTVAQDLKVAAQRVVANRRSSMSSSAGRLNALSPLATLSRGYAVARRPNGDALTRAAQFIAGENFDLTLDDGTVGARVEDVKVTRNEGTRSAK